MVEACFLVILTTCEQEGVATGGRCGLLAVFVEDLGLAKGIIVVAFYDRTIASKGQGFGGT